MSITFHFVTIIFALFLFVTFYCLWYYYNDFTFKRQVILELINNAHIGHKITVNTVKTSDHDNTEAEIKRLQSEMESLNYIFMKKRMSVDTYDKLYAELETKITNLKQKHPKKDNTESLQQFLNSGWQNVYNSMSRENKRTLWRNLIEEIQITESGIVVSFL